jgi:hypothetical protein
MNVVYDQIIDDKPVPNGIFKKDLINTYLRSTKEFEYYYPLTTPFVSYEENYIKSSEAENGIYPIGFLEPRIINENFLRLMFDYGIDSRVIEKLENGKLTLVIYLDQEPNSLDNISVLYDFCKKRKITNFFIYVNVMPTLITDEEKKYRIRYAYRFYNLAIKSLNMDYLFDRSIKPEPNVDYIFNVFGWMGNNYDFRSAMVYVLLKLDLHKKNLISHNNELAIDTTFTTETESIKKICSKFDYSQFKKAHDLISEKLIQHTKLSLVLEAYFDDEHTDGVYLTEKSFRPIYYKKPFLILGQQGSLLELRKRGFKTFNFILDEWYDMLDNDNRFKRVLEQVLYLNLIEKGELNFKIERCEDIVDYNYNHMLNCIKSEIDFLSKQGAK